MEGHKDKITTNAVNSYHRQSEKKGSRDHKFTDNRAAKLLFTKLSRNKWSD